MKRNRIIWGLVALVVLITIAISLGTPDSYSQQSPKTLSPMPTPDNNGVEDLSKYPIVNYDAPLPENAAAREERKIKNKRYDNQLLVSKNPHPETDGTTLFDEIPPPSAIPIIESNLVIVGEIINANAYLSNDKRSVYSEYDVRVREILKEDDSNKIVLKSSISVDRTGGYVRYSNAQKVLYTIAGQDLPRVGCRYVLFLTTDKQSPNYKILTGYEFKEEKVIPLDTAVHFDNFTGINELNFIKAIRNKISELSQPAKR